MTRRYGSLYERLVANTYEPIGDLGCWIWRGHVDAHGYPRINVRVDGRHRKLRAHVVMSELIHGPTPAGWHVDHRCRNRACICPEHVEPVTQSTNQQRRVEQWRIDRGIEDEIATIGWLRGLSSRAGSPSSS